MVVIALVVDVALAIVTDAVVSIDTAAAMGTMQ